MQIPTYSTEYVYLRLPDGASNIFVEVFDRGVLKTDPALTPTMQPDGRYAFVLPFDLTTSQKVLLATWHFDIGGEAFSQDQEIQVVSHYLDAETEANELGISNSDAYDLEQKARLVIDGFCKQSFGRYNDVEFTAMGTGRKTLYIGRRIITIKSFVQGSVDIMSLLAPYKEGDREIRLIDRGQTYFDTKSDAWLAPPFFSAQQKYTGVGDFGWRFVPQEVQLATRMLMKDYLQPQSKWHEQNLRQLSTADWALMYASQPVGTTGNANVDKILSPFRQGRVIAL